MSLARPLRTCVFVALLGLGCAPPVDEVVDGDVWLVDTPRMERVAHVRVITGDLVILPYEVTRTLDGLDVELPRLEEIGGDLYVSDVLGLRLPALRSIGGDARVRRVRQRLALDAVEEIGGDIDVEVAGCLTAALGPAFDDDGVTPIDVGCQCERDTGSGFRLVDCEIERGDPTCNDYLACQEAVDAESGSQVAPQLMDTYGPDGSCWSTTEQAAQACRDACRNALDAQANAFPDVEECRR